MNHKSNSFHKHNKRIQSQLNIKATVQKEQKKSKTKNQISLLTWKHIKSILFHTMQHNFRVSLFTSRKKKKTNIETHTEKRTKKFFKWRDFFYSNLFLLCPPPERKDFLIKVRWTYRGNDEKLKYHVFVCLWMIWQSIAYRYSIVFVLINAISFFCTLI